MWYLLKPNKDIDKPNSLGGVLDSSDEIYRVYMLDLFFLVNVFIHLNNDFFFHRRGNGLPAVNYNTIYICLKLKTKTKKN